MVVVDSSVWVDYFNSRFTAETNQLDAFLGTEPVAIGDLILVEVLQGFRKNSDYETGKELLSSCTIFEMLGTSRAFKAADNYRFLRKKGITIRKTTDTIIATFCIEQKMPLLFSDRDFDPFVQHLGLGSAISRT